MRYTVSATWNGKEGIDASYGGIFDTIADAVEHIEQRAASRAPSRVWINGLEVTIRNGLVIGPDGTPLAANPSWHDLFPQPIELPDSTLTFIEEMSATLREMPTRAPSVGRLVAEGKL